MKKSGKKTIWKVVTVLLLIPVIGIGVPYGGAYVYGRVQHAIHKSSAINCLAEHQSDFMKVVHRELRFEDIPYASGIERVDCEDGIWLFQLPYDHEKLFDWVPCGLMYNKSQADSNHWRKSERLNGDWFFFWDTN